MDDKTLEDLDAYHSGSKVVDAFSEPFEDKNLSKLMKDNKYYYSNYPTTPIEMIYIKRNRFITYRDFYEECVAHWQHDCGDHRFLEIIEITNDTQIDMFMGS